MKLILGNLGTLVPINSIQSVLMSCDKDTKWYTVSINVPNQSYPFSEYDNKDEAMKEVERIQKAMEG